MPHASPRTPLAGLDPDLDPDLKRLKRRICSRRHSRAMNTNLLADMRTKMDKTPTGRQNPLDLDPDPDPDPDPDLDLDPEPDPRPRKAQRVGGAHGGR